MIKWVSVNEAEIPPRDVDIVVCSPICSGGYILSYALYIECRDLFIDNKGDIITGVTHWALINLPEDNR